MFDFGIDKMIVVAVLVGLIMGPERLRELRRALPRHIGRLHALYQQGRAQVVDELNELAPDWREYDPRPLHPRRILKDIAAGTTAPVSPSTAAGEGSGEAPTRSPRSGEDAQRTSPFDEPVTTVTSETRDRAHVDAESPDASRPPRGGGQPPAVAGSPENG